MNCLRLALFALGFALVAPACEADVVISTDPTQNMSCSGGVCSPTATAAVLNVTDLAGMLAAEDVTIITKIDSGRDALNIDLATPFSWANSSTLTLLASQDLSIDAPVTVAGTGGLKISASCLLCISLMDGATITFQNLSSSFVVGALTFTLVGDLPTLVDAIAAHQGEGYYALANDYDAHGDRFPRAPIPKFRGILFGLGHTIANLTIKHGTKKCAGLISSNEGDVGDLRLSALSVSSKARSVGGLAGCNEGLLTNISVVGTVAGSGYVGGIAGTNTREIQRSRAAALVTGNQSGGIAGENNGNGDILLSFATGTVTGNSNTGGLVGSSSGSVTNSYAMVTVSGNGGAAGGLVGFNDGPVREAYSTGPVSGAVGFTGGFVGYDPNERISTSYWDIESSGLGNGAGFPAIDPGIVGLTTAQFQTSIPKGLKTKIWGQNSSINNGYPYLLANPPPE